MQKAISYQRVAVRGLSSPEDSIDHQKQEIQNYCQQNEIDLLHSFEDVGSGSFIDRPGWKALETFVQQNYTVINFLIVKKADRISRRFSITHQIIQEFKEKYGIVLVTTTPISSEEEKFLKELRLIIK